MKQFLSIAIISSLVFASCHSGPSATENTSDSTGAVKLKEDEVSFKVDTTTSKSFVVYNENSDSARPAVLVLPEWWGMNNYTRSRAKQLAELGYIAMAVDVYGNGKNAADPKEAQALATPFYMNPQLTKTYVDAALTKLKSYKQADTANVAAIGYCFGGFVVLNAAKQGADLEGVVSFHGSLGGVPPAKELLKAKVLVCHGGADSFVPDAEVAHRMYQE